MDDLDRVAALPCWSSTPEITPLAGGITNRNYLVAVGARRYVARLCSPGDLLAIDRGNELACHQAAAAARLAPAVVHHAPGVLVSEFIAGETLTAEHLADAEILSRVAAALRALHQLPHPTAPAARRFCALETSRAYAATVRARGGELPDDLPRLLRQCDALVEKLSTPSALCHNDLLPANLVDDGRQAWLIDWELAGVGEPLFDLGGLASNCQMSPDQEEELLSLYFERREASDLLALRAMKALSLLREALWGAVQSTSAQLEFDYQDYAARHFERCRQTLAAI